MRDLISIILWAGLWALTFLAYAGMGLMIVISMAMYA